MAPWLPSTSRRSSSATWSGVSGSLREGRELVGCVGVGVEEACMFLFTSRRSSSATWSGVSGSLHAGKGREGEGWRAV